MVLDISRAGLILKFPLLSLLIELCFVSAINNSSLVPNVLALETVKEVFLVSLWILKVPVSELLELPLRGANSTPPTYNLVQLIPPKTSSLKLLLLTVEPPIATLLL